MHVKSRLYQLDSHWLAMPIPCYYVLIERADMSLKNRENDSEGRLGSLISVRGPKIWRRLGDHVVLGIYR